MGGIMNRRLVAVIAEICPVDVNSSRFASVPIARTSIEPKNGRPL
jgi:hypothetical protein